MPAGEMETRIKKDNYKTCLDYIEEHWAKLTYYNPENSIVQIGLPNKYIVPSKGIYKQDQFYWDTYFIITGLVKCKRSKLAKGMVDNLVYLFDKFLIIPMRNRNYNTGISQPPFLTSMAKEVFWMQNDTDWLLRVIKTAEKELKYYWMNKNLTEQHIIYKGLSRYCDHFITHSTAEHESGWDMTSRFNDHCLNYLPVDLNTCLYKYEMDIAEVYKWNRKQLKYTEYIENAKSRRQTIFRLMWDDVKGFFFDYNFKEKKRSDFYSLAGFYPLWAKAATLSQAERVRGRLKMFEYKGGLANTQSYSLSQDFKQHDYPNGWAHQHWIVIKGLLNYGFREDAKRIAKKWLNMNKKVFLKTGKFWEKYDVARCKVGESNSDRYPPQSGFGWTNAVFLRLINELCDE